MSDFENGFRQTILERLESNHKRNKQTEVFFANYSKLAEQLKNRKASFAREENGSSEESSSDEVARIRHQISELYRVKSLNDQNLIDANRKLLIYEAQISEISEDKKHVESHYKELCTKYAQLEVEIKRLRLDNTNINDERLALNTTCISLSSQKMNLETEREQLLNKISELNEQKIEIMNAEVDLEEKRRNLRIQEQIASAMQETPFDDRVATLVREMPELNGDGHLYDVLPTTQISKMQCDEGEVNAVRWFGGDMFATGGSDRKVRLWRIDGNGVQTKVNSFAGCNASVTEIDYDVEQRLVLASSNDQSVKLWNADTNRLIASLSGHSDQVMCAKFHQTHSAVSGSADRIIKLWDLTNKRCSRSFFPASKVLDIVGKVSMNPSMIISGHFDKKVRFWDGRSSEPVKIVDFEARVCSLDVSASGLEVLCATRDDTLILLDTRNFSILHMYSTELFRTSSDLARCVISPGGDYIVGGSSNGNIFIWNKETTRLEKKLVSKTENPILSVSWNPTGNGILAATKQKVVTYWR